jgi:hypothetical protein
MSSPGWRGRVRSWTRLPRKLVSAIVRFPFVFLIALARGLAAPPRFVRHIDDVAEVAEEKRRPQAPL